MTSDRTAPDPQVSVIVPCHGREQLLREQLEALAEQQVDQPWEVVVVANRPNEDLAPLIAPFNTRLNIQLIHASARANEAYARNTGAAAARGSKLLFCDADDRVAPGWVEALSSRLDRSPIVTGRLDIDELNPPWLTSSRGAQTSGLQNKFSFLPHATTGNLGVRADVFRMVGGFDETLHSLTDAEFSWRAQLAGHAIDYVPEAVVHYRLRTRPTEIFRQARSYARADRELHRRFESLGMPRRSRVAATKAWIRVVCTLPTAVTRRGRARLAWVLGYEIGRYR